MKRTGILIATGLLLAGGVGAQSAARGPWQAGGGNTCDPPRAADTEGAGAPAAGAAPWGPSFDLPDLSAAQREKIAQIERETAQTRCQLIAAMAQQGYPVRRMLVGARFDEPTVRAAYDAMAATREGLFDLSLEARRQIEAVLTPEQRARLARGRPAP